MGKNWSRIFIRENNFAKYNTFIVIWSDVLKKKKNRRDGRKNQAEELRDVVLTLRVLGTTEYLGQIIIQKSVI